MNFHRFRIIFAAIISTLNLTSQPKNPLFHHIYADHGLASDHTTVVEQDYLGYVWVGTEEGLNKFVSYNKFNFKTYKSERADTSSINHDYVTDLFEDSQKNLWVGTISGLNLYSRSHDRFIRINDRHPVLNKHRINAIAEKNRQLWLATDNKLFVYNYKTDSIKKTFEQVESDGDLIEFNDLYTKGDHIWIGASNGLYFAQGLELELIEGFENVEVTSITQSETGDIVCGTKAQGVWRINKQGEITKYTIHSEPAIISNQVNDVHKISDNKIWVGTKDGLTFLDINNQGSKFHQYDFDLFYGISDHEIRNIYEDNSGGLWITTPLGGLNYYHASDNQFDYFGQKTSSASSNELMDYNILSLYSDTSSNVLWIGTRSGISKYLRTEDTFIHYPFEINGERFFNQILSIKKDQNGLIWLGTQKGLFTWNESSKIYQRVNNDPNLSDQVNAVFIDMKGTIWVGTEHSGLKRISDDLDEINVEFALGEEMVSIPNINDIMQLPDSSIWVGTANGLFQVNEKTVLESYPLRVGNAQINNAWVNFLCKSFNGELIVGTRQEGMILIDKNSAKDKILASRDLGLSTNDIRSMLRLSDSLTWISTNMGLTRLKTLEDSVINVANFYMHDGLQGKQFSPKAGAALNNHVYFGGLSGMTHFNALEITEYDLPLTVNFTGLKVKDRPVYPGPNSVLTKSLEISDTLVLQPEQNNFTISFAAMDYMRPDSIKYRYKLSKYDEEWIHTTDLDVNYTNIPRGKQYVFTVQAISRFRNWSEPRTLVIYMTPYFYERAWFKILIAFLTVGILFAVLRYREQASVIKQRNLKRLVDLRTKELKLEVEAKEKTAVELEKAKNDAEKANRIKSEFLANISHEIRTPLNGILGMSHLVSENEPNPENREMLNILGSSAKSLREIIDDLLDLSKIEAGKYDIAVEEFNLKQLAREIVMAFEPEARLKNIALLTHIDSDIPEMLIGDELRIKQVLVNLLSNSLKFTDSGSIELSINLLDNQENKSILQIGVRDTGIGIPYDKQDDVFSSFSQVESGSKRKYGGTGLGLAISKKLILLMGGTIVVESIPGEGSFFKIELALSKSDGPGITADLNIDLSVPEGRKILLVEDNAVNTIVATKMLQKTNQMVDTANNGKDALVKAEKNSYDLILMDIQMPVMDGLEATLKIRQSTGLSANTPIVALTAGAMHHDREKALKVGMSDFIPKPISYDQLEKVLIKYLNNPEEVPSMLR